MLDYAINKKFEEEKIIDENEKKISEKTKRELTLELKNMFNQRLIKPEFKSRFDLLYNTYFKCLICNDTLFDPVLCSDCEIIFCKSCVFDLDTRSDISQISPFISCKHENITEIPVINKRHFEKISLRCFYYCNSHDLNLLNYSAHISRCKYRHDNNTKQHFQCHNQRVPNINPSLLKVNSETSIEFPKYQEEYSSKLIEKLDKLEITFELTNQKLEKEIDIQKQLTHSFKTALIDERFSKNLAIRQMLNLFATYNATNENDSESLNEQVTLLKDENEEDLDLINTFENNKNVMDLTKDNDCKKKVMASVRFSSDEICKIKKEYKNKFITEFLNKYNIPKIDIEKDNFENFVEKNIRSDILYLKETNTDVEILNTSLYEYGLSREQLIDLILKCISICFSQFRILTGVYISEDLKLYSKGKSKVGLCFNHYEGINLLEYVLDGETKKITDKDICELLIKLVEIIVCLHNLDITYYCLRPEDIIVTKEKNLILTNYHHYNLMRISGDWIGYINYSSPMPSGKITCKFDIWSIGAIMIHLFSGRIPWKNFDADAIEEALYSNPTDVYKYFDKNHLASLIILNCCRKGQEDRLSSIELLDDLKIIYNKF